MTPAQLQDELVAALESVFGDDDHLKTSNGEFRAPRIYKQDLPTPESNDDEDTDGDEFAPYIIVRLGDGTFEDWGEALKVNVIFIICTYDPTPDRQGTRDVMSIISRIYRRFASHPHAGNFTCELPIEWALQNEVETHPYYFGGVEITFKCPGVLIEDPLA